MNDERSSGSAAAPTAGLRSLGHLDPPIAGDLIRRLSNVLRARSDGQR
jgi:hypothetical protein